jgi:hypothetical protein
MLEFKEVIYLYRLYTYSGKVEEINTTEGYARIDYNRGYYWHPLTALPGVPNIPWHFLKEDSTLYVMREEPVFYA